MNITFFFVQNLEYFMNALMDIFTLLNRYSISIVFPIFTLKTEELLKEKSALKSLILAYL